MGYSEIINTILTEFPYALMASILVGVVCSFLGVYVVSKRVVFLGATLTQISVLGLALTFLPLFSFLSHTVGMLLVTLVSVVILARLLTEKKMPKDAVLGVAFATSIALRTLIMAKAPKVEVSEVENLLKGDILFVLPDLFYLLAGAFILAFVVLLVFRRQFTLVTFDPETAQTQGFNVQVWESVFYLLTALIIAVTTHVVGDMFVFGFLVIPPAAALLVSKSVSRIFLISVIIGLITPVVGLILAFRLDVPSSPAIVGVAGVVLGGMWLLSLVRTRRV